MKKSIHLSVRAILYYITQRQLLLAENKFPNLFNLLAFSKDLLKDAVNVLKRFDLVSESESEIYFH